MATIEALRAQKERHNPAFALAVICTGYFMVILDATVTNVALPSIGRGLHGSVTGLQWVVDAYTLSFAGLLLTGGALAERLGSRRIFAAGLIIFGAASGACGRRARGRDPGIAGLGAGGFHSGAPGRPGHRGGRLPGRGHSHLPRRRRRNAPDMTSSSSRTS